MTDLISRKFSKACAASDYNEIRIYIQHADLSTKNNMIKFSKFVYLCKYDIVKLFIRHGAVVHMRLLHDAIKRNKTVMFELLYKNVKDQNFTKRSLLNSTIPEIRIFAENYFRTESENS